MSVIVTELVCFFVCSSQIFYKDDLNWLKGIGCYAWDTPEILRVKHAGDLQSEVSPPTVLILILPSISDPLHLFGFLRLLILSNSSLQPSSV